MYMTAHIGYLALLEVVCTYMTAHIGYLALLEVVCTYMTAHIGYLALLGVVCTYMTAHIGYLALLEVVCTYMTAHIGYLPQAWPDDALQMVANKFLEDVEMEETMRTQCVSMCQYFHQSVRLLSEKYYSILRRRNYVTPTSYLELILTFKSLLFKKRDELTTMRQRYLTGLEKLQFAASQVRLNKSRTPLLVQDVLSHVGPLFLTWRAGICDAAGAPGLAARVGQDISRDNPTCRKNPEGHCRGRGKEEGGCLWLT